MSDLISRQALCDDLREYKVHPVPISSDESEVKGYNDGIDLAISVIAEFPSAESERKTGKWIDVKINSYTSRTCCSECGSSAPFIYKSDDYYSNHAHGETARTKFCPNCGADMRLQNT